jgi:hypothetical protein
MIKKIYDSNEITGRIYLQLCNLFPETLLQEDKDLFFGHAFAVMHKLNATKYHLDNYKRIEKVQFDKALYSFKKGNFELLEQLALICCKQSSKTSRFSPQTIQLFWVKN